MTFAAARIASILALWKPDLWISRKAACSRRSRVRSGSRALCFFFSSASVIPTSMYAKPFEHQSQCLTAGCPVFSIFVTPRQCVYEKLENQPLWPLVGRPKRLLVRHSSSKPEMLALLCHVIVVNLEHHMHCTSSVPSGA